jgi:hypothetical protein
MGVNLFDRNESAPPDRAALAGRYLRRGAEKSSNSAVLSTGKILPYTIRHASGTIGTAALRRRFLRQNKMEERRMYIGLGGLLILILVLWLLGVI